MAHGNALALPQRQQVNGLLGLAAYGPAINLDFTSGNQSLDKRITFSRASNATVTGSDGLIKYAPHNLLTYSEQFDNAAWNALSGALAVTANTVSAPNNTTTADTLALSNSFKAQQVTLTTGVQYTFSVYVRTASGTASISFKELNGSAGTVTRTATTDWQRLTFTFTAAQATCYIGFDQRVSGSTQTGSVYIWGAQLEIGSTARTYNPTTVKNLLGYSEAFDNAAWTKTNSFVQTNLLTYSQDFDNAAWTKSAVTLTANTATAPDSTATADSAVPTTSSASHIVLRAANATVTATIPVTSSVYVKPNGYNFITLRLDDGGGTGLYAGFNVSTGVVSTAVTAISTGWSNLSAAITSVGNGWYRCSVTGTPATATAARLVMYVDNAVSSGGATYAGDGTSGVYLWGAQLVQGSVAGDYQATYAASAAVQYQAPNGTLTADKFVTTTAASAQHIFSQSTTVTAATVTLSLYAKAGGYNFVVLQVNDSTANGAGVSFNVSTGAVVGNLSVGSGWSVVSSSITPVGNDWYRCAATILTTSSTKKCDIDVRSTNSTAWGAGYTGDGTSGVYIWGAQLSDSASVDTYVNNPVAAPSAAAYYGPRFDYDPVTLQPKGLLIEEQRTNLQLYSEQFDNAAWDKLSSASITANQAVSPSGLTDADLFTAGAVNSSVRTLTTKAASSITYTGSVYVKAGSGTNLRLWLDDGGSNGATVQYNTTDGSVVSAIATFGTGFSSASSSSTAVGNGWYRYTVTATSNTATSIVIRIGSAVSGVTFYVWGAQLEAGAFATSYIPTVASQVTRSADVALIQGSNFSGFINQTNGSLFTESATMRVAGDASNIATISDGTSGNGSRYSQTAGTQFHWFVSVAGAIQVNLDNGTFVDNVFSKLAGAYKVNDFASVLNGGTAATDTVGNLPFVDRMNIGANATGAAGFLNGTIKKIAYYPRRLTNSELQAITS